VCLVFILGSLTPGLFFAVQEDFFAAQSFCDLPLILLWRSSMTSL
jgi:hypothetical protein